MFTSARPASSEAGLSFSGFALLAALLAFSPLIKGGNRPLPLLILEVAVVVLLCLLLIRPQFGDRLSRTMLLVLATLVAIPLIQLIPIPMGLWENLPGREHYALAMGGIGVTPEYLAASLHQSATEGAWLTLLLPLTVFLATVSVDEHRLKQLVNLVIALALLQAIIGLAQFGTGSLNIFWPPEAGTGVASALGTYANYNHLAGFLEMTLPMVLGLLVANIRGKPQAPGRHKTARDIRSRIAQLFTSGIRFNLVAIYIAVALGILLGIIFSRSRTGIALAMIGIFLCAILFGNRAGGQRSTRMITFLAVIGSALALEVGLAPVLARFADGGMHDQTRWSIYTGTLQGIWEFFPVGSGFGTYPEVFRRFQPGDVPLFVNHAHNDYLEWLFEGGLPAGILMLALLALYILRWREIWPKGNWTPYCFMRVSAGISLLLMALHGFIDFNLHIPANAIYFAFLAGVFFHSGTKQAEKTVAPPSKLPEKKRVEPPAINFPVQQGQPIRNPFAEE